MIASSFSSKNQPKKPPMKMTFYVTSITAHGSVFRGRAVVMIGPCTSLRPCSSRMEVANKQGAGQSELLNGDSTRTARATAECKQLDKRDNTEIVRSIRRALCSEVREVRLTCLSSRHLSLVATHLPSSRHTSLSSRHTCLSSRHTCLSLRHTSQKTRHTILLARCRCELKAHLLRITLIASGDRIFDM